MISEEIFRAYDVRGVYGKNIDENVAYVIGRAFASYLGKGGRALIGRDVRLSGESLSRAVAAGLIDEGFRVDYAGTVPTPTLYLSVVDGKYDCGIQVTASHNPPEWNGFKLVLGSGETISEGMGMEELKRSVLSYGSLKYDRGRVEFERVEVLSNYVVKLLSLVSVSRPVRVAIDFSNGAVAVLGKRIFESLGCEVIPLNDEPDGNFPAHLPEPNEETMRELAKLVRTSGAEFGIGFDGDGDRAVFIDERGVMIDGDIALAVLVSNSKLKGKVVYDVSSSSALEEVIRSSGCEPVLSRVGRAFMLKKVREVGAVIGAEKSNHFYFSELYGFDDGIFAALRMIELVSRRNEPFSKLVEAIPRYHTSQIHTVDVPDRLKFEAMRKIAERLRPISERLVEIDGVKAYFRDGWVLIRPSNTMPQIKYVAEARDSTALEKYLSMARDLITEATVQRGGAIGRVS
ncbi:MAG: phosphomannomutase/phosphoglucomutase [Aigarchaeota archaeon]|nr:phosphomannomutase/phosphoglucomutase [Aigarchaeota archaeon]MDW8092330.1 phosphomannomutase/phosphoglucomutase [Nitrososphaerota archaeon]